LGRFPSRYWADPPISTVRPPLSGACQFSWGRSSGGRKWALSYFPRCSLLSAQFSRANCSVLAGFGWRTCPLFFFCGPSLVLPTSHSLILQAKTTRRTGVHVSVPVFFLPT